MNRKLAVPLIAFFLIVCLLPVASAQVAGDWNVSSDWDTNPIPTASPSPNPTQRIGSSLIGNLALFAILPIAVGAMVFFIALKGFGQNGEDTSEVVLPALLSAVIITVMVEVCVYIAVYIVNAMGG